MFVLFKPVPVASESLFYRWYLLIYFFQLCCQTYLLLIDFFIAVFCPHLGSFFAVVVFFSSLRFGQISPLVVFRWLTATSDKKKKNNTKMRTKVCNKKLILRLRSFILKGFLIKTIICCCLFRIISFCWLPVCFNFFTRFFFYFCFFVVAASIFVLLTAFPIQVLYFSSDSLERYLFHHWLLLLLHRWNRSLFWCCSLGYAAILYLLFRSLSWCFSSFLKDCNSVFNSLIVFISSTFIPSPCVNIDTVMLGLVVFWFSICCASIRFWGCPRGVMVKVMDSGIVKSVFVLQSRYYVHFQTNTLGKGMNPLILPAMG